jgi:anaerobic ribonucleoside-triphosphate reductase
MKKCNKKMEIYSRVVGFFRPVQQWNKGMKSQFSDRKTYNTESVNAK